MNAWADNWLLKLCVLEEVGPVVKGGDGTVFAYARITVQES